MAITFVGSTEITYASTAVLSSTNSINIGTRTKGVLGVIVNVIGVQTVGDPTSVTWNGVGLTKGVESGGQPYSSDIWYLFNPASGTNDLVVNFSGTSGQGGTVFHIIVFWADSDNDLEVGDTSTVAAGSADPTSIDVDPTAAGALCVSGYVTADNNVASTSDTLIQDWDQGGNCSGANYLIAGTAGTYTLDWDRHPTGQAAPFNLVAAAFQEADAGSPPSVVLDTANAATFNDDTPSLLFTGTDVDADDIRYNVQIADNDGFLNGEQVGDSYVATENGIIHPNPMTSTYTWQDTGSGQRYRQVDDRPGQAFVGQGGILTGAAIYVGSDPTDLTAGYVRLLVYNEAHATAFGTDSGPASPADPADTPTPGWIAESDWIYIDDTYSVDPVLTEFEFTGANQIRLTDGGYYHLSIDWLPDTFDYDNTIRVRVDGLGHAGNLYLDGASVANNGPYGTSDLAFTIRETFLTLDKLSGTDAGFANVDNGADTDPFTSGDQVSFTVQAGDALADFGYWWRVRGIDPSGTNTYGDWTTARTFTVDTAGGPSIIDGAATLSGSGAMSGAGAATLMATGSLSGAGALAGVGAGVRMGAGALSGDGSLSAEVAAVRDGSGELSGAGTLAGIAAAVRDGSATMSGDSNLAASGYAIRLGVGQLAGLGSLAGDGEVVSSSGVAYGEASLSGAGSLTASGMVVHLGSGMLTGAGNLTGSGISIVDASGVLSGAGDLAGQAVAVRLGAGNFAGDGDLNGNGLVITPGNDVVSDSRRAVVRSELRSSDAGSNGRSRRVARVWRN